MTAPTILHNLERHASAQPDRVAYRDKLSGSWRSTSWRQYDDQVSEAARAMLGLGLGAGDVVTILSANRPEWAIAALGAMRMGGVSAGIYTTCSADEIAYIVSHAESPLLVVETLEQLQRVEEAWPNIPSLKTVVFLGDAGRSDDERVIGWQDFLEFGRDVPAERLAEIRETLTPDTVADFIYTSGTTGPPKAVMLTHDNLAWTSETLGGVVDCGPGDVALSYLPLSHIAEQTSSILMPITFGYEVWFCEDGLQLASYLKDARPTVFFGVPRVWERFAAGIGDQLAQATGAKAKIAAWAQGVGREWVAVQNRGEEPSGSLKARYAVADRVLFSKLRTALGFDRTRLFVSGAAPIPGSVLDFFASIGIAITEIYGQSEDTGPTTTNLPGATKYGTVGRPIEGVEVKLADDGEILVRGRNVFAGYYKNESATASTLVDGWLESGDLGEWDDEGYLKIVGRKKDIIITSGGKNIAPQNIEEALSGIDVVAHAVVIGEQQRFLVSLLTLEPEASARFASEHGLSREGLHEAPEIRKHLEDAISANVNPMMARVEHVRNFVVLPNEFSTDSGELTPTFKVKRNVVNDMYAAEIAALYDAGQVL